MKRTGTLCNNTTPLYTGSELATTSPIDLLGSPNQPQANKIYFLVLIKIHFICYADFQQSISESILKHAQKVAKSGNGRGTRFILTFTPESFSFLERPALERTNNKRLSCKYNSQIIISWLEIYKFMSDGPKHCDNYETEYVEHVEDQLVTPFSAPKWLHRKQTNIEEPKRWEIEWNAVVSTIWHRGKFYTHRRQRLSTSWNISATRYMIGRYGHYDWKDFAEIFEDAPEHFSDS